MSRIVELHNSRSQNTKNTEKDEEKNRYQRIVEIQENGRSQDEGRRQKIAEAYNRTWLPVKTQNWLELADDFVTTTGEDFTTGKLSTWQEGNVLDEYKQEKAGQLEELQNTYSYAERFAGQIKDKNKRQEYLDTLSRTKNYLDGFNDAVDQQKELFSSFEDADAYNTWKQKSEQIQSYQDLMQAEDFEEKAAKQDLNPESIYDNTDTSSYDIGPYQRGLVTPIYNEKSVDEILPDKLGFFLNTSESERLYHYYGTDRGKSGTKMKPVIQEGQDSNWDQLTDDEISVYYYLYNTQGQKAAYDYLDAYKDILAIRKGQEMAEDVSGNSFEEGLFTIQYGLQNVYQSLRGMFSDEATINPWDVANQEVRENLDTDFGKVMYDLAGNIAYMAPSMLVGYFTGPVGFGVSAGLISGGNAYQQALREGYSPSQARMYGVMSGTLEGAFQAAIGKTARGAGVVTSKVARPLYNAIKGATAKMSAKFGISVLGEGVENYIQTILDPVVRNVALGEDNEFHLFTEDALYNGFLGVLTASVFSGAELAASRISNPFFSVYGTDGYVSVQTDEAGNTLGYLHFSENGDIDGYVQLAGEGENNFSKRFTSYGKMKSYAYVDGNGLTQIWYMDQATGEFKHETIDPNQQAQVYGTGSGQVSQNNAPPTSMAQYAALMQGNTPGTSGQTIDTPIGRQMADFTGGQAVRDGSTMAVGRQQTAGQVQPGTSRQSAGDDRTVSLQQGQPAVIYATGQEVTVTGIGRTDGNGSVQMFLSDGTQIDLADLEFENPAVEEMILTAAEYPTAAARAFVSGYDGSMPFSVYRSGFDYIYRQAINGMTFEQAVGSSGEIGQMLSPQVQYLAYTAGRNVAGGILDENGLLTSENGGTMEENGGADPAFGQEPRREWAKGGLVSPRQGSVAAYEQQVAADYSVPSFVVRDEVYDEGHPGSEAFSFDGQIYFRENIDETKRGRVAAHEINHVMRQVGFEPYLAFLDALPDMLDTHSKEFQIMVDHVASHAGVDPFNMTDAESTRFFDELNATIYGYIATNDIDMLDEIRPAFMDWDGYTQRIQEIHREFKGRDARHGQETAFAGMAKAIESNDGEETDAGRRRTNEKIGEADRGTGRVRLQALRGVEEGDARHGQETGYDGPAGNAGGPDSLSAAGNLAREAPRDTGRSQDAGNDEKDYRTGRKREGSGEKAAFREIRDRDNGREVRYTGPAESDLTPKQKRAAEICRSRGRKLHVFKQGEPIVIDGAEFSTNQIAFSLPGTNWIFSMDGQDVDAIYHESFHLDLADGDEDAVRLLDLVKSRIDQNNPAFQFYVRQCMDLYAGEPADAILNEAYEAMAADAIALAPEEVAADVRQYAYAKTPVVRERLTRLFGGEEALDEIAQQAVSWKQNGQNPHADYGENVRFSVNTEYAKDIERWDKKGRPAGYTFDLGTTGDVLQGLGAIESDIYMQGDKISLILSKHTEMSLDTVKRIPEILESPLLVLKSKTRKRGNSRIVLFGNVMAENRKPVLCVLDLLPVENHLVVDDMQKVVSAYTKTNREAQIADFLKNSEVLYTAENKKVTARLLRTIGFYMPIELQQSGYIGSISYRGQNVNITGKKFSEVFTPKAESGMDVRTSMDEAVQNEDGRFEKSALDHFGRTYSWKETGYLTISGKKLDFSGRHEGASGGYRTVDHRDILDIYPEDTDMDGNEAMVDFMSRGNIRIMPEGGGINLQVMPTSAQFDALDDFISKERGEVALDIDDESGKTVVSLEYPKGTKASKVLNDIKQYFQEGIIPQISDLAQFRYSMDNISPTNAQEAIRENAKLRGQIEALKQEFKLTKGHRLDQKAIDRLAGQILGERKSGYDRATLAKNLNVLFDYIANHEEINYDSIMQIASEIAKGVLMESESLNTSLYDQYKDMRDYFRHTGIRLSDGVKSEIASLYGSYDAFRKRNFGKIRLSDSGTYLDSLWAEIAEKWPEFFDADATEQEQPVLIVNALNTIQPSVENAYGMNMDEAAMDLAMQMFDAYFDIPEVKTFADKKQAELTRLRIQYGNRLRDIRSEYKARYDERLKQVRQENVKKRQELSRRIREEQNAKRKEQLVRQYRRLTDSKMQALEKQKAKYEQRQARQREQRDIREAREKIKRVAGRMKKLLINETDLRHIPEEFRVPVARLLNMLDFTTDRMSSDRGMGKILRDLQLAYEKIGNEPEAERSAMYDFYDAQVSDDLEEVARITEGKRIVDLGLEELQKIYAALRSMETIIQNVNKLFFGEKRATVTQYGRDTIRGLNAKKAKKPVPASDKPGAKQAGEMASWAEQFLNGDMLIPYYFFKQFDGLPIKPLFDALYEGENVSVRLTKMAEDYARGQREKYGLSQKDFDMLSPVQTSDGVVQMTLGERMALYASYKREIDYGSRHFGQGGFMVQERKGIKRDIPEKPMRFKRADFLLLENSLTENQRGFVNSMVKFLSEECATWGNYVNMKMFGRKKYTDQYYFPFKTVAEATEEKPGESQDIRLKNKSFSRQRMKNANAPLMIEDFMQGWSGHAGDMANYRAFVLPIEDLTRVWNYKEYGDPRLTVKSAIKRALGDQANRYIRQFLKDLNGGVEVLPSTEWFSFMTRAFKRSAVGMNLRVMIQQPTALARALSMIDAKYLLAGTPNPRRMIKEYEEAKKYAPVYILKEWGSFDTHMNRGLYKRIMQDHASLDDVTGYGAQKADEIAWGQLWYAVKRETADKHPDIARNSEEFYRIAAGRVTDIVRATQVYDSVFKRSQMMRSQSDWANMATSFMSEPTLNYNMMWDAYQNVKSGTKTGKKKASKIIFALLVSLTATAGAAAFIDAFRDDEDEKKDENGNIVGTRSFWDKYADAFVENMLDNTPFEMIPILRDIISIFQGYDVVRTDMNGIVRLYRAYQTLTGDASNGEKLDALIGAVAYVFGIPYSNLSRDVQAIYNTFFGKDGEQSASYSYWQLYQYQKNGNSQAYDEAWQALVDAGKKESDIKQGLRDALMRDDIRIAEAGLAYREGDAGALADVCDELEAEGFDRQEVAKTVRSYVDRIEKAAEYKAQGDDEKYEEKVDELCASGAGREAVEQAVDGVPVGQYTGDGSSDAPQVEKAESIYTYDDVCQAVYSGDTDTLTTVMDDLMEVGEKNGKSEKEVASTVRGRITAYYKPLYQQAYPDDDAMYDIRVKLMSDTLRQYGIRYTMNDFSNWIKEMAKEE